MSASSNPNLIESLSNFIPIVKELCGGESWGSIWQFRGQSRTRKEWPLMPKAGRKEYFGPRFDSNAHKLFGKNDPMKWEVIDRYGYTSPWDMRVFSEWMNRAIAYRDLPDDDRLTRDAEGDLPE